MASKSPKKGKGSSESNKDLDIQSNSTETLDKDGPPAPDGDTTNMTMINNEAPLLESRKSMKSDASTLNKS